MKAVYILFGEMGSGKSYYAVNKFVNGLEGPAPGFLEGDSVLTPEMVERAKNFKHFTKEMVSSFIKDNLYPEIVKLLNQREVHPRYPDYKALVVSQALYSNQDRLDLIKMLSDNGIEVMMIWVKPPFLQNLKQLWSRPKGLKWVLYWLLNKPFFQKPTHHCITLPYR